MSDSKNERRSARDGQRVALVAGLVVAVVALVAIVGYFALGLTRGTSDDSSASSQDGALTVSDVAADEDASADEQTDQTEQESAVPADDERAASLALDPTAQTEWRTHGDEGENVVYLTFDDGPSSNTQAILDVLAQYGVKATFFVTGHDPANYDMIAAAYAQGHTIGMHTMSHDYTQVYASEDAYFGDLSQISELVRAQIGYVPYLIRFPGGASNTVSAQYTEGIMTALTTDVLTRGYQYYDWNVSSGDASGNDVAVETLVANSCRSDYRTVMLLLHDSPTKSTTVEALPQIIEYYQGLGFEFRAIDRTTPVIHHAVNN